MLFAARPNSTKLHCSFSWSKADGGETSSSANSTEDLGNPVALKPIVDDGFKVGVLEHALGAQGLQGLQGQ